MSYNDEPLTPTPAGSDFRSVDPQFCPEEKYWRDNYECEPYYRKDRDFVDYGPAFRAGYEGRRRYTDMPFEEAEGMLRNDYDRIRGASLLNWDATRSAALAAWNRAELGVSIEAYDDGR